MKNGQLKTVYHPIEALIFAEYNPRQLTKDQYDNLRDSIKRFGLIDPIIINKHPERENVVIGGHQRLRISKDLGIEKVPCVELNLELDEEKELNVRLNRNVGEWDYDALANYFDVSELLDWGFQNYELGVDDKFNLDENELWEGMPEYENENITPFRSINVRFRNEKDIKEFCDLIGQKITNETKSIWHPKLKQNDFISEAYISEV
jgi:hypothetical protein